MRRWYMPSWHGDLRLERAEVAEETILTIEKPTADEVRVLNQIGAACVEKGWLDTWTVSAPKSRFFGRSKKTFRIKASLETVGPVVAAILRPGPAVLTAIKLSNGMVELASAGKLEAGELPPAAEAKKPALPPAPEAEKPKPEAAVTVKRPTPSCPACTPGSIGPATEVLLEFLDPEQHASWARERTLVCYGGSTGRPYLLAHRHTKRAQRQGRICMDLSSGRIVHFHDWTVPPEEEVLASKLILEHAEDWLRNEATMLVSTGSGGWITGVGEDVMKNPFGGFDDGIWDAGISQAIGDVAIEHAARVGRRLRREGALPRARNAAGALVDAEP